jgi:hypothetical protein
LRGRAKKSSTPAATPASVTNKVNEANTFLRRAGVRLIIHSIEFEDDSQLYNIPNKELQARLMGLNYSTAVPELKVFFVNSIDNGDTAGFECKYGIAISKSANNTTLAHEVGHACGWQDVYDALSDFPYTDIFDAGVVKAEYLDPKDWGVGWYDETLQQFDLVKRLLMYGYSNEGRGHIPHGSVYGVYIRLVVK